VKHSRMTGGERCRFEQSGSEQTDTTDSHLQEQTALTH
jgi:hypothetical protein